MLKYISDLFRGVKHWWEGRTIMEIQTEIQGEGFIKGESEKIEGREQREYPEGSEDLLIGMVKSIAINRGTVGKCCELAKSYEYNCVVPRKEFE
jgi:hypothetical protein